MSEIEMTLKVKEYLNQASELRARAEKLITIATQMTALCNRINAKQCVSGKYRKRILKQAEELIIAK